MNKFLIAMMAACGCMMVNAEGRHCRSHSGDCTDTHCRAVGNKGGNRHVANLHAKIDAVRKYVRKERNADKCPISAYSNVKDLEPVAVQAVVPVVAAAVPTVVGQPAAETKVVNIYGGSVIVNN